MDSDAPIYWNPNANNGRGRWARRDNHQFLSDADAAAYVEDVDVYRRRQP